MWDDYGAYRTQVALANYVPGPLNPPGYDYEPRTLDCGCSEEDSDGIECGYPGDVPEGYDEH